VTNALIISKWLWISDGLDDSREAEKGVSGSRFVSHPTLTVGACQCEVSNTRSQNRLPADCGMQISDFGLVNKGESFTNPQSGLCIPQSAGPFAIVSL